MTTDLLLPELGENITSGVVVKVLVQVGDTLRVGQPVVEIETDKAVVEVPAEVAGVVAEIHVSEGDEIVVGQKILSIRTDAAPAEPEKPARPEQPRQTREPQEPAAAPAAEGKEASPSPRPEEKTEAPEASPATGSGPGSAPAAPSVRRFAREIGVDIHTVPGTGPGGRISMDDVKAFSKRAHQAHQDREELPGDARLGPLPDFTQWGSVRREPMTRIRRTTAARLGRAWATVPQVTHFDQADAGHMEAFRKAHEASVAAAGGRLTVTALLVKIAAAALQRFPVFNAAVDMAAQEIVYKGYVNIGVAVDTDQGLLVPVIKGADRMSLTAISVELTRLARAARDRRLSIEEMQGGNFTISNLGGIGGTGFTPIVNAPEVAILGMSRHRTEIQLLDGRPAERLMLPLALSYDHRVIDGADAARFLRWVASAVEQPLLMHLNE